MTHDGPNWPSVSRRTAHMTSSDPATVVLLATENADDRVLISALLSQLGNSGFRLADAPSDGEARPGGLTGREDDVYLIDGRLAGDDGRLRQIVGAGCPVLVLTDVEDLAVEQRVLCLLYTSPSP